MNEDARSIDWSQTRISLVYSWNILNLWGYIVILPKWPVLCFYDIKILIISYFEGVSLFKGDNVMGCLMNLFVLFFFMGFDFGVNCWVVVIFGLQGIRGSWVEVRVSRLIWLEFRFWVLQWTKTYTWHKLLICYVVVCSKCG